MVNYTYKCNFCDFETRGPQVSMRMWGNVIIAFITAVNSFVVVAVMIILISLHTMHLSQNICDKDVDTQKRNTFLYVYSVIVYV